MDKKNLLAILLVPIAIAALVFSGAIDFGSSPKKRPRYSAPTPTTPQPSSQGTRNTKPKTQKPNEKNSVVEHAERVSKVPWGLDPFMIADPFAKVEVEGPVTIQALSLEFTFFNGKEWVASVSGNLVKKGDWIGEEQVTRIVKDRLTLSSQLASRDLLIQKSSIDFSIEAKKERKIDFLIQKQ